MIITDRDLLKQYDALKEEQADLIRRIQRNRQQLNALKNQLVSDTVIGSREDLTIGPIKITGKPAKIYSASEEMLHRREEKLRKSLEKSDTLLLQIEEYIYTVPDARIRNILRLRYLDGKHWEQISRYYGKSTDWARKAVDNYFRHSV